VKSFLLAKLEKLCMYLCVFDSLMLPSAIIFSHLCLLFAVPSETMEIRNSGEKRCTRKIEMSPHLTALHGMMACKDGRYSTAILYVHKCFSCHFMKPGDFEDMSVSNILYCVQSVGLLNE